MTNFSDEEETSGEGIGEPSGLPESLSNASGDVEEATGEVTTTLEATGDALDATGVGAVIGVGLNILGAVAEIGGSIAEAFDRHKANALSGGGPP